jgi:hypothetical protein
VGEPHPVGLPLTEWTEVFGSGRLTGILLDRLTHHAHILEMNGDSPLEFATVIISFSPAIALRSGQISHCIITQAWLLSRAYVCADAIFCCVPLVVLMPQLLSATRLKITGIWIVNLKVVHENGKMEAAAPSVTVRGPGSRFISLLNPKPEMVVILAGINA